jgi:hypothetical protein
LIALPPKSFALPRAAAQRNNAGQHILAQRGFATDF